MSASPALAAIVWGNLLEVVVVGAVAGIGLGIAFSLLVRGAIGTGTARREGRGAAVLPPLLLAVVSGAICLGAVVFAVYEMVSG